MSSPPSHPHASVDVVIVGGGPAGLSAALILGRCRRTVLLCDDERPRNATSKALHGFLTRDGIAPMELRRIGREQLAAYDSVSTRNVHVASARRAQGRFEVTLGDATTVTCRKLLLATGVVDDLPDVDGIADFYGTSVFHCPYCDGWEVRDKPIAIYGSGENGPGLALELTAWSRDLVLCTDGGAIDPRQEKRMTRFDIAVRREPVVRVSGANGSLETIEFESGPPQKVQALFFSIPCRQRSNLAASLGCTFTEKGAVATGEYETTNVPGLYVAGDASRLIHLAVVAAAEGAQAAFAMNTALLKEDLAGD